MSGKCKDDAIAIGARIPEQLKKRLDMFCAGGIDELRHVQEDVIKVALEKFLSHQEELKEMSKL